MRKILAAALCVLFSMTAFAGEGGYKVKYDGGSISNLKAGEELRLELVGNEIHLLKGKDEVVQVIPAATVTEITYGQDVHRRVGALSDLLLFRSV